MINIKEPLDSKQKQGSWNNSTLWTDAQWQIVSRLFSWKQSEVNTCRPRGFHLVSVICFFFFFFSWLQQSSMLSMAETDFLCSFGSSHNSIMEHLKETAFEEGKAQGFWESEMPELLLCLFIVSCWRRYPRPGCTLSGIPPAFFS